MPKLVKNYYYDRSGNKKLNCYLTHISKNVVNESEIRENDNLKIYAKEGKIIIEKLKK